MASSPAFEAAVADSLARLDALKGRCIKPRYQLQNAAAVEPALPPTIQVFSPHALATDIPDLTGSDHGVCKWLRGLAYLATLAEQLAVDTEEGLLPTLHLAAASAPNPARSRFTSRSSQDFTNGPTERPGQEQARWMSKHAHVLKRLLQRQAELEKLLKNVLAQAAAICEVQPDHGSPVHLASLPAALDIIASCMVTLLQMQCALSQYDALVNSVRVVEAVIMQEVAAEPAALAAYDAFTISVSLPGQFSHPKVELLVILQQLLGLMEPPSCLQHFLEWEICSSVLGSQLASRPLLKVSAQHACQRFADALQGAARSGRTTTDARNLCSAMCLALLHVCIARNMASSRLLRYLTHDLPRAKQHLHIWGPVSMRPLAILLASLPAELHHLLPRALQIPTASSFNPAASLPASAWQPSPAEHQQRGRSLRQQADLLHLKGTAWLMTHRDGCLAPLLQLQQRAPLSPAPAATAPSSSGLPRGHLSQDVMQRPNSTHIDEQLHLEDDISVGWITWLTGGLSHSQRPLPRSGPSPSSTQASSNAIPQQHQQTLLAVMDAVIAGHKVLQESIALARELAIETSTMAGQRGRVGLLRSLLLALSTAQAIREWMARHASSIAQLLPFMLAILLQALSAEVGQQQDSIHRARRLVQLKRSAGISALWNAAAHHNREQDRLNEREALCCSLEAGVARAPSQYELIRIRLLATVLASYGVPSNVCNRMASLVSNAQDIIDIASGSYLRYSEQLCLLQQPAIVESLLRHMLADDACVLLLPQLARTLDHDTAVLRRAACCGALLQSQSAQMLKLLEQTLLLPMAESLHSHLLHQVNGSDDGSPGASDNMAAILNMPPFYLLGAVVSVRSYVEAHLYARVFLQIVSPTPAGTLGWATLSNEIHMAALKHGLRVRGFLPAAQQVAVSHDLRALLADVSAFCEANCYSLASHLFVESPSVNFESSRLNSLSIVHCTASFQTHGLGLLDATTQAVYHFLVETIYELSEWLFDRDVQARLQTELTALSEARAKQQQSEYEVEQAQATIAFSARKAEEDGQPRHYVDAVRQLLTLIGNGVALLRLAHHGALHLATSTLPFLQLKLAGASETAAAVELAQQAGAEAALLSSAARLDRLRQDMTDMIQRWPLHLKALVASFSADLRSQTNVHFQRLYLLLPAVTHNYVEVMLLCKERLQRRAGDPDSSLAAFTDDGFPLGMAYMLAVLQQEQQFDALHWFSSAQRHYKTESQTITQMSASAAYTQAPSFLPSFMGGQALQQGATEEQNTFLQLQNVKSYAEEYHLLERTLESCRTLFTNSSPSAPATPVKVTSRAAPSTSSS